MAFEKLFFVLCPSFHGATLLSKLLNSHPEITSLGDTYPSNRFDQTCGCGEKVSQCEFWKRVKTEIDPFYSQEATAWLPNSPSAYSLRRRLKHRDYLLRIRVKPKNASNYFSDRELGQFADAFSAYLEAISNEPTCGGRVFVDGVKSIIRLSSLAAAGTKIDGIIHLTRNPVDFVASTFKNTGRTGLPGLAEHSLRFRAYHSKARLLCEEFPSINVSYEQLATEIDKVLFALFSFMGCAPLGVKDLNPHYPDDVVN